MILRLLILCLAFGGLFLALRYAETRSIYFPVGEMAILPARAGLGFEDIFFETADRQKLNGWFVPGGKESDVILFAHGNAGNISYRIDKLIFLNRLGYSVFIFDYRGYGKSTGWPSEKGLYRDAEAAYDYLVKTRGIPAERIVGYGESIGGAVIVDLASRRPMKAVALENTFTSVTDMLKVHLPLVPAWALASRFDAKQKIALVRIPKLIMQSENDEIVPARLGKALFEAAAEPKEFLAIRGGHNEGFFDSGDLIEKKLRDFLSNNR
jgi:fermentation-respiration switch protein FrsA (DUF1100 family)